MLIALPGTAGAEAATASQAQWKCIPGPDGDWLCQQQHSTALIGSQPDNTQHQPATIMSDTDIPWDWLPKQQLPETHCNIKPGCDGAYVPAPIDSPDLHLEPAAAPTRVNANRSSMEGELATFSGAVVIHQGSRQIKADQALFNRSSEQLTLTGNVEIREGNTKFIGEQAEFDSQTGAARIEPAHSVNYDSGARVSAASIERQGENRLVMEQASYTQCTPDDEVWKLKASNITLNNASGFGTAKHARLNIYDVPLFYTPYLLFPIDDRRMSGFLWPVIGYSSDNGMELSVPYYFNLAPNYDATLTPHYIEERGTLLEAEMRYLNHYGEWQISGGHLNEDDISGEKRWLGGLQHQGGFNGFSTAIDYSKISDDDYFEDLNLSNLEVKRQTHLTQQAILGYSTGHWSTSLKLLEYQTIDDEVASPYQLLPQLRIQNTATANNFAADFIFLTEATEFDHDDAIENGGNKITGQRLFNETGIRLPMRWAPGFIIPTVKVRHLQYRLDEPLPNGDDEPSATTALATLDTGLVFERDLLFGKTAYLQTLEPRLYYFYSDYEQQDELPNFDTGQLTFSYNQLFRDTRFSGHDRLDDAKQLSIGVTTRFIDNDTGWETLTLSAGQIVYFADRKVRLNSSTAIEDQRPNSNFAADLQYQPNNDFWLNSNVLWNHRSGKVDEGGFAMHYRGNNATLYNLGYRFQRQTRIVEQADASVVMPVGNRWKLFARSQYDLDQKRPLEGTVGIEYQDCCWISRIVYQRVVDDEFIDSSGNIDVEYDYALVFEFQLKGLGSLGSKANAILQDSILGYNDSE